LIFCFVDVEEIEPLPRAIQAPVWLFLSRWTANAASTYYLIQQDLLIFKSQDIFNCTVQM
jgi:hypothetical protein